MSAPEEIPQIKPASLLDPPQIKLSGDPGFVELEKGDQEPIPVYNRDSGKMKFVSKIKLPRPKINFKGRGNKKVLIGAAGGFVVFTLLVVVFLVLPALSLYRNVRAVEASARALKDSLSTQDINIVKGKYNEFKTEFSGFGGSYRRLAWVKFVPVVGGYYRDGEHMLNAGKYGLEASDILITTMEPYADIIGFGGNGDQAQSGDDTANDRIEFLIQSLGDIIPKADELAQKAKMVKEEVEQIDTNKYPETFRGIVIREKLVNGIEMVDEVSSLIAESKPLLESAPYLLGVDEPRTYLLLFQNDKELRPTGGFITAYSIIKVVNGKIEPVSSNDIYNLDNKYTPQVEAADPIVDYLKGPYLISKKYRLRDMNWSPDFRDSMELFLKEAETAGIEDIDGVIAVDTQVVVSILNVIGKVSVAGYGDFTTENDARCNCPQVIYELESFADVEGPIVWSENEPGKIVFAPENYLNRKEIVGPLMNGVLGGALGQPKEKVGDLFQAMFDGILQKHILAYFFDEKAQAGAEGFNMAGRLQETDGDYLQITDANLGGRKSNLYVTQEVSQEVTKNSDGTVNKKVTITYQNPQDYDGWLNSVLPNWTRVYVPKGSELISSEGFDKDTKVYEEEGKIVFAGGFELRPKGIKKVVLEYKVPVKFDKKYNLLIQKQAGKDKPLYGITVGKNTDEFFLLTDKQYSSKI